jgi:hypothetical protein
VTLCLHCAPFSSCQVILKSCAFSIHHNGPGYFNRRTLFPKTHHLRDASSKGCTSKGRIVQGTHHPRHASSKGCIIEGAHHSRTHCPRDASSKGRIIHGHVQGTHKSVRIIIIIATKQRLREGGRIVRSRSPRAKKARVGV